MLTKLKLMVELYCDDKDIKDKETFDGAEHPDAPKWPTKIPMKRFEKSVKMEDINARLKDINEKIEEFEKKATEGGDDQAKLAESFTGVCFVVMKSPKDAMKVCLKQPLWFVSKLKSFFSVCTGCCFDVSDFWLFERAPEPTDVFWENLGVSTFTRLLNSLLSWFFTAVVILAGFGIIGSIKRWQKAELREAQEEAVLSGGRMSYTDKGAIYAISGFASAAVVIINELMKYVMRAFSMSEKHETQTKMNVSVALKLTLARFVNSSAVLVIVNWAADQWFDGGNLVYDATILIGMLAVQAPAMEMLYVPGIIKWLKKKKEMSKGTDSRMT